MNSQATVKVFLTRMISRRCFFGPQLPLLLFLSTSVFEWIYKRGHAFAFLLIFLEIQDERIWICVEAALCAIIYDSFIDIIIAKV